MSIDRQQTMSERRKRLHDLVDYREELKDLQANLVREELMFADAVQKRSTIMNKTEQNYDDEDQFLETLRISEEAIHYHRQKILEIQAKIIDAKENILSLEILVKLDERRRSNDNNR